jgi:hypothetical protein
LPTFEVRLDTQDPVQISDTSYAFTGLRPGNHTVSVQALDANGTPIPNTQQQVQFTVVAPTQSSLPQSHDLQAGTILQSDDNSLSLLGVVGFGILIGGALSLYRNRDVHHKNRRASDE